MRAVREAAPHDVQAGTAACTWIQTCLTGDLDRLRRIARGVDPDTVEPGLLALPNRILCCRHCGCIPR